MAFSGGVKFYEKNYSLLSTISGQTATTGDDSVDYAFDRNPYTVWKSVGSDDTTTESIAFQLTGNPSVDAMFLIGHNFKDFNVKYFSGGYQNFSGVTGLDGSMANITETVFSGSVAYYEFTAPAGTGVYKIDVLKTQTANAQKYINQIIFTKRIGAFTGYPQINNLVASRNSVVQDMLSGRRSVFKSIETFGVSIDFNDYPTSHTADLTLAYQLYDRDDPFLVWLCGGNRGTSYFQHTLRGFRLQDVIPMHMVNAPQQSYNDNIYMAQANAQFDLQEVTT